MKEYKKRYTSNISDENLKIYLAATVEQRLNWLEESLEFVDRCLSKEQIERWQKIQKAKV